MDEKRLWEAEHPYYCNEGNFYAAGCIQAYSTWADFMAAEGKQDMDLNLVFRWDWRPETDEDGDAVDGRSARDPYYRGETLWLFYMGQRKGAYRSVSVEVCRADEPEVRAWLMTRWEHMRQLWAPLSGAEARTDG